MSSMEFLTFGLPSDLLTIPFPSEDELEAINWGPTLSTLLVHPSDRFSPLSFNRKMQHAFFKMFDFESLDEAHDEQERRFATNGPLLFPHPSKRKAHQKLFPSSLHHNTHMSLQQQQQNQYFRHQHFRHQGIAPSESPDHPLSYHNHQLGMHGPLSYPPPPPPGLHVGMHAKKHAHAFRDHLGDLRRSNSPHIQPHRDGSHDLHPNRGPSTYISSTKPASRQHRTMVENSYLNSSPLAADRKNNNNREVPLERLEMFDEMPMVLPDNVASSFPTHSRIITHGGNSGSLAPPHHSSHHHLASKRTLEGDSGQQRKKSKSFTRDRGNTHNYMGNLANEKKAQEFSFPSENPISLSSKKQSSETHLHSSLMSSSSHSAMLSLTPDENQDLENPQPDNTGRFPCLFEGCGRTFQHCKSLWRHQRALHNTTFRRTPYHMRPSKQGGQGNNTLLPPDLGPLTETEIGHLNLPLEVGSEQEGDVQISLSPLANPDLVDPHGNSSAPHPRLAVDVEVSVVHEKDEEQDRKGGDSPINLILSSEGVPETESLTEQHSESLNLMLSDFHLTKTSKKRSTGATKARIPKGLRTSSLSLERSHNLHTVETIASPPVGSPQPALMRRQIVPPTRFCSEDFVKFDDAEAMPEHNALSVSRAPRSGPWTEPSSPILEMATPQSPPDQKNEDDEKPYACVVEGCGTRYKGPSGLHYHMHTTHREIYADMSTYTRFDKPIFKRASK